MKCAARSLKRHGRQCGNHAADQDLTDLCESHADMVRAGRTLTVHATGLPYIHSRILAPLSPSPSPAPEGGAWGAPSPSGGTPPPPPVEPAAGLEFFALPAAPPPDAEPVAAVAAAPPPPPEGLEPMAAAAATADRPAAPGGQRWEVHTRRMLESGVDPVVVRWGMDRLDPSEVDYLSPLIADVLASKLAEVDPNDPVSALWMGLGIVFGPRLLTRGMQALAERGRPALAPPPPPSEPVQVTPLASGGTWGVPVGRVVS